MVLSPIKALVWKLLFKNQLSIKTVNVKQSLISISVLRGAMVASL